VLCTHSKKYVCKYIKLKLRSRIFIEISFHLYGNSANYFVEGIVQLQYFDGLMVLNLGTFSSGQVIILTSQCLKANLTETCLAIKIDSLKLPQMSN
jgi:hypothetical protein